jgi:hypothetical protein
LISGNCRLAGHLGAILGAMAEFLSHREESFAPAVTHEGLPSAMQPEILSGHIANRNAKITASYGEVVVVIPSNPECRTAVASRTAPSSDRT